MSLTSHFMMVSFEAGWKGDLGTRNTQGEVLTGLDFSKYHLSALKGHASQSPCNEERVNMDRRKSSAGVNDTD